MVKLALTRAFMRSQTPWLRFWASMYIISALYLNDGRRHLFLLQHLHVLWFSRTWCTLCQPSDMSATVSILFDFIWRQSELTSSVVYK